MELSKILHVVIFLLLATLDFLAAADGEVQLSVLVGEPLTLECPIVEGCGGIHSIRWYKGESRIALVAEIAKIIKIDDAMKNRIEITLSNSNQLKIAPTEVTDEAQFRCELTYMEPIDNCKSGQIINVRTLLKPKSLAAFDQNKKEINKGSLLGGLLEDSDSSIECKAIGGRPIPKLIWTLNGKEIPGDISSSGENENSETINKIVLIHERKLHGAKLKCSASSEALTDPLETEISLDLILRPTNLSVSGVEHHVVQGSKVSLECLSQGANPPAVITWLNDTEIIPADQILTTSDLQTDGTYNTIARLSFWATRWDNNRSFNCESRQLAAPLENEDMHMNASKILDVHYPPIVYVNPENFTVNETTDIILFCEYDANPRKLLGVSWIQNNVELDTASDPDHYVGGDLKQQDLLIKNTSEYDTGVYHCVLKNSVGTSRSLNYVDVEIQFKPVVEVNMDFDDIIFESLRQNVTAECEVISGNPTKLTEVRWFLDGQLLKLLPDCTSIDALTANDICHGVTPSQLLLYAVDRSFHGKYSCQGKTDAGWGPVSNFTDLIVYYEPGETSLAYYPQNVIKDESLTLTCTFKKIDDRGRPESDRFLWYRGTQVMNEITTYNWTIDTVNLETEANFSCSGVNEAGNGVPSIIYIDVLAPPDFITSLTPITGILYNSSEVYLSCRAECSPICRIEWLKDGKNISNNEYTVIENVLPSDSRIDRFESLESNLTFNLDVWPDNVLDRLSDSSNYTCVVIDNGIGPSINSSTILEVEFPPENMTISNKVISITEGQIPEKIICGAKGKPKPKYRWFRYDKSTKNDDGKKSDSPDILSTEYALKLKKGVQRSESGDLVCEAYNEHGTIQISTYLNVLFKPECTITESETNNGNVLICTANANPMESYFEWSIEDRNDTIDEGAYTQDGVQSTLKLDEVSTIDGSQTFICIANNSIGVSTPCTLVVKGVLPWWKWWSKTALMVAAGIGLLLLLVILLCIIIMCICRRKRAASKYNTPNLDDQESSQIQNETSIIQAIVSQNMAGMSKSQSPTTPTLYSEKSRLVPSHNKCIIPQNKQNPNKNPLAACKNSGKLQADLSLLEASYQAGLLAKQRSLSNNSLNRNDNTITTVTNISEIDSVKSSPKKNIDLSIVEDLSNSKVNSESQGLTVNKWPLKPGVLVHVNSNHSLSPKKFNRNVIKPPDDDNKTNTSDVDEKPSEKDKKETEISNRTDDIVTEKSNSIDLTKCRNIMKSNSVNKRTKLSNILKKMDFIIGIGKNGKSDDIMNDDGSNDKRCKSNKMALSLIGFVHKDDKSDKTSRRGFKGLFQNDSPVIVSSEGVVTFRRPIKTNEITQSDITNKNDIQLTKKDLNDNSEHFDTSTDSRSSSNSRKRKKPGEAPTNGGAEGNVAGIDNPGVYENLPFHGMQQPPNKPIQVIQPVVRALAIKNNSKSPEALLERQLKCNPSFTPRILSCPPFSHNSNLNLVSLQNTNLLNNPTLEINQRRSNQNVLFSTETLNRVDVNPNETYSNLRQTNNVTKDHGCVDDQKFYSLNVKRERVKKNEPRFNSMKIVRKRKLDRFYPSKHRIDYIIINKNPKNTEHPKNKTKEVVYANCQPFLYPTVHVENNVNESFEGSFQNLTDSIQIHEHNSFNKTPTPAPRLNKSAETKPKVIKKTLPKDHVYANVSLHIALSDTPKTLPRRCLKANVCKNLMTVAKNTQYNASTFPKRTTKSGKLFDTIEDKSTPVNKTVLPKGKIITSKSPSRNHSFNDALIKPDKKEKTELNVSVIKNNKTPSIIDATPKSKSTIETKSNSTKMENELEVCWEKLLKPPTKIEYVRKKTPIDVKNVGKVIPKQQMLIKPPDVPLQIPNLQAKPIPKITPTHLKRSQSSLSGKGISTEFLQQYKGATGLQDGSLVRAKIRELNLRQAYRPNIADQLIYADADLKDYGPINYKQASIYARMKKVKEQQKMELQRADDDV